MITPGVAFGEIGSGIEDQAARSRFDSVEWLAVWIPVGSGNPCGVGGSVPLVGGAL